MPLTMQPKRKLRPAPVSFRLSETAYNQLQALSDLYNVKQVQVIETLLGDDYVRAGKKYGKELKAIKVAR